MPDRPELSPEDHAALAEAGERATKVVGAAKVAAFNGWTLGIFAALTVLFGLKSLPALLLGAGMALVARNEFRGRDGLRRLDPGAARMLGRNQIGLMALIIGYCVWSLVRAAVVPPDPQLQQLEELAGIGGDLVRQLTMLVYVAVIAGTLIFQGLNARYYFRRVGMLDAYLRETPPWIVDLQRSTQLG